MAYSLDKDTKIATMDGVTYGPKSVTDARTGTTELIGLTEDECKVLKAEEDARPAWLLERLRQKRNSILSKSDWMANSDVTMSDEWKTYRQALRDITKTYKSIEDDGFKWPTEPS